MSGDICSVVLLGQPLIILNSHETAVELLEKRSASSSDRPEQVNLPMSLVRLSLINDPSGIRGGSYWLEEHASSASVWRTFQVGHISPFSSLLLTDSAQAIPQILPHHDRNSLGFTQIPPCQGRGSS